LRTQLANRDRQLDQLAARLDAIERPPSSSPPQAARRALPQVEKSLRQEGNSTRNVARRDCSLVRMAELLELDFNVNFSQWLVKMRVKLDEFDGQPERFKIRYILTRTTDGLFVSRRREVGRPGFKRQVETKSCGRVRNSWTRKAVAVVPHKYHNEEEGHRPLSVFRSSLRRQSPTLAALETPAVSPCLRRCYVEEGGEAMEMCELGIWLQS
jgi:hypothetical protein